MRLCMFGARVEARAWSRECSVDNSLAHDNERDGVCACLCGWEAGRQAGDGVKASFSSAPLTAAL